ncbi:MAG: ribosome assembly factor SBDS [Candidatus Diapherotrites archaeon]|uniref:Ribosome assembly factor SBDS n=1 Tax=Candidatus Iainarchaeum sp. TaxID=3101447 RepID=A0A938YP45_9ARCH|nr:ribosome assembly factor SBDS [Candidatus Diapherotrites archaeon]
MVKLEDAVTARLQSHGEKFEILVDPDLALKLKKGEKVNFDSLLAVGTVFKDAAKGEAQSPEAMNKAFGSADVAVAASKIVMQGTVHLTTEQRRAMKEAREKELIEFISRNAVNPQTKAPHPPKRIENALAEAKVRIDESKSIEEQLPSILKELKKAIPISMEQLQIAVKVGPEHSGRASSVLHRFKVVKEQWQNDGSVISVIELPAGMRQDFLNELNNVCHGSCETKILQGD